MIAVALLVLMGLNGPFPKDCIICVNLPPTATNGNQVNTTIRSKGLSGAYGPAFGIAPA